MSILTTVVILAGLATLLALTMGIIGMMHGGQADRQHGTHLMFARVGLQGFAFVMILIALLVNLNAG